MDRSDKALAQYFSLDLAAFDLFERCELRQQEIWIDCYSSKYVLSLELYFVTGRSDDQRRLHLVFDDVQQLQIKISPGRLTLPLIIRSLHNDQWEYLRYHVRDQDDEQLSFYSRHFAAQILDEKMQQI